MIEISKREAAGETVLAVSGCLDTASTPKFSEATDAVASGMLVVDMTGLEFIASSSLRQLVKTKKRLIAAGGDVELSGVNDVIGEVMRMTGLDEVFVLRK